MDDLTLGLGIFLFIAGFISALIDSVVGGGGLIAVPALMATGMPPMLVLGTNKLASCFCSSTSTASFFLSGKIEGGLVKFLIPLSFGGALLGVYTLSFIPPDFLKPLVIVLLILVAIYTVFKKEWGTVSSYGGLHKKNIFLSALFAFILGYYDGFFGPGAGTFLIFAFLSLGFDFVQAAGNAKALNFASNLAAVLTFGYMGSIQYSYSIIMGIGMILGAVVGSQIAIRKGSSYVRPLFLVMVIILVGKQIFDFWLGK